MAVKKVMGVKRAQVAGIAGLAVAAAGAAAAGYYFYASKEAAQNRKIVKKWAQGLKKDVIAEAKKLEKLDKAALAKIVTEASSAYETVKGVDKKDLTKAGRELKANWKEVVNELQKGTKSAKKVVKSVAKTTQKKVANTAKAVKKTLKK